MTNPLKEHPLVFTAGAVAATIVAMMGIYSQAVIRTQTAGLQYRIDTLNSQVETLKAQLTAQATTSSAAQKNIDQKLASAEESLRKMKTDLDKSRAMFLDLQSTALFSRNEPYPAGFRKVKIGDPIARVAETFPEQRVNKKDNSVGVQIENSTVTNVTYFSDDTKKDQPVTHVVFEFDWRRLPAEALNDRLIEALGQPTEQPISKYSYWDQGKVGVFKAFGQLFLVGGGLAPAFWPPMRKR